MAWKPTWQRHLASAVRALASAHEYALRVAIAHDQHAHTYTNDCLRLLELLVLGFERRYAA